jgi:hypothetical protein
MFHCIVLNISVVCHLLYINLFPMFHCIVLNILVVCHLLYINLFPMFHYIVLNIIYIFVYVLDLLSLLYMYYL